MRRMCWTDLIHIQTANPVQSWLHTATSALFFADSDTAVSTARAGNVIGGGDFASDRIIPDCYRSAVIKQSVTVRNPYSIRPYQHVLEPLFLYLTIVKKQWEDPSIRGYYNVGPDDCDCVDTWHINYAVL